MKGHMQNAFPGTGPGRPQRSEAAAFYFTYIDQVDGNDILRILEDQLSDCTALLSDFSEESSLQRYAPDKWSIRQVVNHMADTERVFSFRALWFGRGLDGELPSFDQQTVSANAEADKTSLASHVEDMRKVRLATLSLFRNLPASAWMRSGIASGNTVTVRALAFMTAGHCAHHIAILRERYR